MGYGVRRRCVSDPALLWLWLRPVATAPIGPLAWEPAHAVGVALEKEKKKKKTKKNSQESVTLALDKKSLYRLFLSNPTSFLAFAEMAEGTYYTINL